MVLTNEKERTSQDTVISVSTFGGFEIATQLGTLTESDLASPQAVKLLTYFLLNPDVNLSRQIIANAIWPASFTLGQVKTAICRARRAIAPIMPDKLILTAGNCYHINPCLHVVTDCGRFDMLATNIRKPCVATSQKVHDLCEISRLYRQDFLPGFLDDPWINNQRIHYHFTYLELAKETLRQMSGEQSFPDMLTISGRMLELEPYDSAILYWHILALSQLGMPALAAQHFHRASLLLEATQRKELHALLQKSGLQ